MKQNRKVTWISATAKYKATRRAIKKAYCGHFNMSGALYDYLEEQHQQRIRAMQDALWHCSVKSKDNKIKEKTK